MKLYGRQYRLELGAEGEAISIDSLRIAFEVKKTSDPTPNPARIAVWNLNRDHINLLTSRRYNRVRLFAGYAEMRQIFVGEIIKPAVRRDGLDFVIELECSDGDTDYRTAYTAVSLAAGATDKDILSELGKSMPNTQLGITEISEARALPRGRVLCGNTRDLVQGIATNQGAEWSIQDGELVMLAPGSVLPGEAVVLSEGAGMVGSPEPTDDGLQITSLLNPALRVGGMVKVESIFPSYNGIYKVTTIEYRGDAKAADWFSVVTCVGGEFQKVATNG